MTEGTDSSRTIVLLHGFAAHWTLMTRLQKHFQIAGHQTVNWGYTSWFKSIEYHADRLQQRLAELDQDSSVEAIDFVTHSMGCIVTRAALLRGMPNKAGRWVQLAPPNRGSHVANRFPDFIKSKLKPIEQLQSTSDSYVNRLPVPEDIDIAIVLASQDFIVHESLTGLEQEKDRLTVPGLHSQMLFRDDVAKQSLHFLRHGKFAPSLDVSPSEPE